MKKVIIALAVLFVVVAALYVNNSSRFVSVKKGKPFLLAHRGVHQTYDKTGIDSKTCTAQRIYQPEHDLQENTLPSIDAAFKAGADMVEIDIHPTTDGHFAVFHDWTLDCRTEGKGVTRTHSLEYLKKLDIGYGYTADSGKTFPFRGKGVGQLPSLKEVFERFPDKSFLINFKSKDATEADRLAGMLQKAPASQVEKLMVYGGAPPSERMQALMPKVHGFSKKSVKDCLIRYELVGWSGYVPEVCRNTGVMVPLGLAHYLWGWPHKFIDRMKRAGTVVFVVGDRNKAGSLRGIDTVEQVKQLPENYSGAIWTNKIEVIGEHFNKKR